MSEARSGAVPRAPGLQHPLMGARLALLVRVLIQNGGIAPRHAGLVAVMGLSALTRTPFSLLDDVAHARATRKAPPCEDPLIILGHWRTGTTHLHNLMGCSPAYGHISPIASGLPDQILTLGTWLAPMLEKALPEDRHVDRVAVTPASPQEDEIPLANQQPLSIFHAVYFPRHFQRQVDRGVFLEGVSARAIARWQRLAKRFAERIALHQSKPRIVIKNPVYTARIARLLEIWPRARFIHIRRNPYEVFVSTRHYYTKLLGELALQSSDHIDIDAFVLATFKRLMAAYERDRALIPAGYLAEVSYERLLASPLDTLADLHDHLALPGWREARPAIATYLERIAGYRTNPYEITRTDRDTVDAHLPDALDRWEAMAR